MKSKAKKLEKFEKKDSRDSLVPVWPKVFYEPHYLVSNVRILRYGYYFLVPIRKEITNHFPRMMEMYEHFMMESYRVHQCWTIDLSQPHYDSNRGREPMAFLDIDQRTETEIIKEGLYV